MNDLNLIRQSLIPNESFKIIATDSLLENILNPPKLENDLEDGLGGIGYADMESDTAEWLNRVGHSYA